MFSIFVESSETQGLLYNRYKKIPEIVKTFMDDIENAIKNANSNDTGIANSLEEKLLKFKTDIKINMTNPDPINKEGVTSQRKKCAALKEETLRLLDRLGKLKKTSGFSSTFKKAKVYAKNTDTYMNANKFMRTINRSTDWCEKIILDLLNLTDQDMNLLSVVQKVYFRSVFEWVEDDDILLTPVDEEIYESYLNAEDETNEPEDDKLTDDNVDILDTYVNDEEYMPIYGITIGFTKESIGDTNNKDVKTMMNMGNLIKIGLKDTYTHTLFAFDTNFDKIYHFVSKGIRCDDIRSYPIFEYTDSVFVNVTFVTKKEFNIIKKELDELMANPNSRYDIMSIVSMFLKKSNHKNRRMVCSSMLGYLLSCGNIKNVHKDYSLVRPEDVTLLPRSFYVIEFRNREDFLKKKAEFERRVKSIYNDNIEEIKEYNNMLPKIVIKGKLKEKKTLDGFFDWIIDKM